MERWRVAWFPFVCIIHPGDCSDIFFIPCSPLRGVVAKSPKLQYTRGREADKCEENGENQLEA
jgi:hypothetical protein